MSGITGSSSNAQSPLSNPQKQLDTFSTKKRLTSLTVNKNLQLEEGFFLKVFFQRFSKTWQKNMNSALHSLSCEVEKNEANFNKIKQIASRARVSPESDFIKIFKENVAGICNATLQQQPRTVESQKLTEKNVIHLPTSQQKPIVTSTPLIQPAPQVAKQEAQSATTSIPSQQHQPQPPTSPSTSSAAKVETFATPVLKPQEEPTTVDKQKVELAMKESTKIRIDEPSEYLLKHFQSIDSSKLIEVEGELTSRSRFLKNKDWVGSTPAPIIGRSAFISDDMLRHLMTQKKGYKDNEKYVPGDAITNMQGAAHSFVTPVCSIRLTGDYHWVGSSNGGCKGKSFEFIEKTEEGAEEPQIFTQLRPVIMSAAIHPDLQNKNHPVVMGLIQLTDKPFTRTKTPPEEPPLHSAEALEDDETRADYDKKLGKYLLHHLTSEGLPAVDKEGNFIGDNVQKYRAHNPKEGMELIKNAIKAKGSKNISELLKNQFVRNGSTVISLEVLFNLYREQLTNEFRVLNAASPKDGFIYTLDPPAIFVEAFGPLGGAKLLNYLQILAFKSLNQPGNELFGKMKILGFNNFLDDKEVLGFLKTALPEVHIVDKKDLYNNFVLKNSIAISVKDENGNDKVTEVPVAGKALVIHNNSDAFGDNITLEGESSMDGVIGVNSDAAAVLKLDREDLLSGVM